MLAEQQARGQLNLGAFYMRRLLRLYPALLVMVAIAGSIFVALGGNFPPGQIAAAVFYYTNYYTQFSSYIGVPPGMFDPFAILWSLAVEEHYYLVYPALVFLLARTRLKFLIALCVAIVVVTVWRYHVANACSVAAIPCIGDGSDDRILQSTDTRIDSILYGAVLATLLGTRLAAPLLRLLQSRLVFVAGLALLLVSFIVRDAMFRDTARFTIQGIGLFLAGGSALFSARLGWVRALLCWRPVLLLGRWSYSLYLWHAIVLMCVVAVLPDAFWRPAVEVGRISLPWDLVGVPAVLALSVAVAAMSYKFVEMPMVAFRRRFGSHAIRDGAPAQPAPGTAPV